MSFTVSTAMLSPGPQPFSLSLSRCFALRSLINLGPLGINSLHFPSAALQRSLPTPVPIPTSFLPSEKRAWPFSVQGELYSLCFELSLAILRACFHISSTDSPPAAYKRLPLQGSHLLLEKNTTSPLSLHSLWTCNFQCDLACPLPTIFHPGNSPSQKLSCFCPAQPAPPPVTLQLLLSLMLHHAHMSEFPKVRPGTLFFSFIRPLLVASSSLSFIYLFDMSSDLTVLAGILPQAVHE